MRLQPADEPLFPDLLWSKPENKNLAGKLLIVGGQAGQFTAVSKSYSSAVKAGTGHTRVLLPASLEKATSHSPNIEYAAANRSGSFAKHSLAIINDLSDWSDGVLLAGNFGKNSETTTVLDGYLLRCPATVVVITENALSSISLPLEQLIKRPITISLSSASIRELPMSLGVNKAMTTSLNLVNAAEILAELTTDQKGSIVCEFNGHIWVSSGGKVSATKHTTDVDITKLSAYCATWLIQQKSKNFQALTTAVYEYIHV